MKSFFVDLWKCYRLADEFTRKHWKGCILVAILMETAFMVLIYKDQIKEYFIKRKEENKDQ